MKKLILAITMIAILFSFTACAEEEKPESVVDQYFQAAQQLDIEKMGTTISPTNTAGLAETENFLKSEEDVYSNYFIEYIKGNAEKMTYTIKETTEDGDQAVVTVDCKYIDVGPVLEATINEVFSKVFDMAMAGTEMTEEETAQMFVDTMKTQAESIDETYTEKTIDINMERSDGQWYIADINDDLLDVITCGFLAASETADQTIPEL